jgi:D-alanine-D-alanine ligase
MSVSQKIRVAVLYGGRSSEHEISLLSAKNVIENLDKNRFDVVPIGIDKQGSWYLGDDSLKKLADSGSLQLSQDAKKMLFMPSLLGNQPPLYTARDVLPQLQNSRIFDVVFPVIHGPLCEDGTVQGLLELAEVPYVGCGVLASAVGMDKDVAKRLVAESGLNVPPYITIKAGQWKKNSARFCNMVEEKLVFPVFVKPSNTGSSVGVHKVKHMQDLIPAIENAFLYDTKVLVEQGINAMELEVSVLESLDNGADPLVSVVGEIRPQHGHEFYSYAAKYLDDKGAELFIPAPISEELQTRVRLIAQKIFSALDCEGMARVDLFLEKETNEIYFNEINTIPGFTQISMYPKLMDASGISYTQLLSHLIDLALSRHQRKCELQRDYVAE